MLICLSSVSTSSESALWINILILLVWLFDWAANMVTRRANILPPMLSWDRSVSIDKVSVWLSVDLTGDGVMGWLDYWWYSQTNESEQTDGCPT